MKRQPRPTYSISAEQAWAAAYAAWRLNGNLYLKIVDDVASGMRTNKEIMMRILTETPEEITDQDREQGRLCRGRLGSEISLRLLKGETLTEWHTIQARLCNTDTFTTGYDLAVLASFPKSYTKTLARDQVKDRLSQCEDSAVGAGRVQIEVEVVECFHSAKWECWFVQAIDHNNRAVMFAYREQLQLGICIEIAGTVKSYDNQLSRLNRVKILEEEAVA